MNDLRLSLSHPDSVVFSILRKEVGTAGPGTILNAPGYVTGYTTRRIRAKTYVNILVIKASKIDHELVSSPVLNSFRNTGTRLTYPYYPGVKIDDEAVENKETHAMNFFMRVWVSEKSCTIRYSILACLHIIQVLVHLYRICRTENVKRFDAMMVHPRSQEAHDYYENMQELRGSLDGIAIPLDVIICFLELFFFTTQSYYTNQGIPVVSYKLTLRRYRVFIVES